MDRELIFEYLRNPLWLLAASAVVGWALQIAITLIMRVVVRRSDLPVEPEDLDHFRAPLVFLMPALVFKSSLGLARMPPESEYWVGNGLNILIIFTLTWFLFGALNILEAVIKSYYDINVADNLAARKVHTQFRYIKRILQILLAVAAIAWTLMLFEGFRQLGTSILASAGIMGLVVALAAQRSLSNLLVGLQTAFTQPIRLDDVVVIEGEWGRIEEITSTYAVVRIWDQRRLIVPLSYFIEKPFQNWTRVSSDLLGTVYLYVDYSVDVEKVREELHRLLEQADEWDKKVWGLQVTNSTERTMELRALMSAPDSGSAWNLRCAIREKLIAFLQREYPSALPRMRVELERESAEG